MKSADLIIKILQAEPVIYIKELISIIKDGKSS
jgi:hypothetical protein